MYDVKLSQLTIVSNIYYDARQKFKKKFKMVYVFK